MTLPALLEPACPGSDAPGSDAPAPDAQRTHATALVVEPSSVAAIPTATWDSLAARNPWATPFSSHAFQVAWWHAYGMEAHEQTLTVRNATGGDLVAIVPLMHRHEVEPTDEATHTRMRADSQRALTPVPAHAKAIFLGATYHADYATLLAAPEDMPRVAGAVADHLATEPDPDDPHPSPWDAIDLRRLRCGDPAADALADAFGAREIPRGWTLNVEREDVCPVAALPGPSPDGTPATFDDHLATLGKKERHEIRRKIRRAEAAGDIRFEESQEPLQDLETFIDLHQRRWGADGLFPDTPGGDRSRRFFRCLFEELGRGTASPVKLSLLSVGGRTIASSIHFDDGETLAYYNAGVDPEARALSPGVLLVAELVKRAIALGRHRLDFLRGDEGYKYEWGAVDEPIQRLLVRRTG